MMLNKLLRIAALIALLIVSTGGYAATIYNVTGPSPFGFANQNPAALGWSQTGTYTNVSITAPLADLTSGGPIGGVEGTVYLVNQIGPGTTSANNVAPPVSISSLTASFTPQLLFSGLTLGPGNYYIVFVSTSTSDLSMSMQGTGSAILTLGSGVTELGNNSGTVPATFPPATTDLLPLGTPNNYFITITGDLSSVPAVAIPTLGPGNMIALMVLLALLTMVALRRQR
jgi:hypothetical protein